VGIRTLLLIDGLRLTITNYRHNKGAKPLA
jgi:hypothetical protein